MRYAFGLFTVGLLLLLFILAAGAASALRPFAA
jgi:hypothetical protein